jgi:hypothetical protein
MKIKKANRKKRQRKSWKRKNLKMVALNQSLFSLRV